MRFLPSWFSKPFPLQSCCCSTWPSVSVLRASISQPHLWSPLLRPSQKIFMEAGWVQEKQCPIINCWDGLRRSGLCSFCLLLTSCMVQGNQPHLPGHTNSTCACSGLTLCSKDASSQVLGSNAEWGVAPLPRDCYECFKMERIAMVRLFSS